MVTGAEIKLFLAGQRQPIWRPLLLLPEGKPGRSRHLLSRRRHGALRKADARRGRQLMHGKREVKGNTNCTEWEGAAEHRLRAL